MNIEICYQNLKNIHSNVKKVFFIDFGSIKDESVWEKWHLISFEEFDYQMKLQGIDLKKCPHRNWKDFFNSNQQRFKKTQNRIDNNKSI